MIDLKVSKDSKIAELMPYPKAIEILQSKGFHCMGCAFASQESIEQGAKAHGMSDEDIEGMVEEINKALEEEGKEEKVDE